MPLADELRPKSLSLVIGNQATVAALQNMLDSGNIPVAFLFAGPSGSGKTTLSKIIAREVQGEYRDAEGLEIQHLNAANENGVDTARRLAEDSRYSPMTGKYRVVILDEAHALTTQAQNALLIPTERNSSTKWVLCTTDPGKLLPALKGRCATFELKPFGRPEVTQIVDRASKHLNTLVPDGFIDAIMDAKVLTARDILNAFEKYHHGGCLEEAITASSENKPEFGDIARHILSGQWDQAKVLLKDLKFSDQKALRSVLASYTRGALLNQSPGAKADAFAELLRDLALFDSHDENVAFAAATSSLYRCTRKIRTS